jgi:hypothetical protein
MDTLEGFGEACLARGSTIADKPPFVLDIERELDLNTDEASALVIASARCSCSWFS